MSMEDIKIIKMIPDKPYATNCDIGIYDEMNGKDRKRCTIKMEYSKYDITQLIEKGLGYEDVVEYYEDWIYRTIRRYLCYEWECNEGYEEVVNILKENIKKYFE